MKRLRNRDDFVARLETLGIDDVLCPADAATTATTFGAPREYDGQSHANPFAVLPMEGWDASTDGRPTDLVERRWQRFGASGASIIWGGEAVAVVPEGRANPRQLCIGAESERDLTRLRELTLDAHATATDHGPAPHFGLQLTHSGRWCRPNGGFEPRIVYRHGLLDERVTASNTNVLTDTELDDLVERFVAAAVIADAAGFDFVDIKHCHGYLLHEILSAHDRPGPYGGTFANRTQFLVRVVAGIRSAAPDLGIGVRLSAFDLGPHVAGPEGVGQLDPRVAADGEYRWAFGGDGTGAGVDLRETHEFCRTLTDLGIRWLCVTAGSPYYCPHVQRPAYFPPSDGYLPPHDPLLDVAAMVRATAEIALRHPELIVITSAMSYLQEWLPAISAQLLADGRADFIGLGRSALSYPELPLDAVAGTSLRREQLCRTFSDCTTAPRNGLVSGCYPLDSFYKQRPERSELAKAKRAAEQARGARRRT